MATVSFANDIAPTLYKYRGEMAWRLDLANYDDVKANAQLILGQLTSDPVGMPPPPYPAFSQAFTNAFTAWIGAGFPP